MVNLLREEETVAFIFVGGRIIQLIAGEEEMPEGIKIHGLCLKDESGRNKRLTSLLSENRIAGYSRATQVSYYDDEE